MHQIPALILVEKKGQKNAILMEKPGNCLKSTTMTLLLKNEHNGTKMQYAAFITPC
jgi:hypothetical protein